MHQTCNHTPIRITHIIHMIRYALNARLSQRVSCYVTILSKSISYHAMLRDTDYWFTITTLLLLFSHYWMSAGSFHVVLSLVLTVCVRMCEPLSSS